MRGENPSRARLFAEHVQHKYHFINKQLLNNTYEDGDVYDHGRLDEMRVEWDTHSNKPYLRHVKYLANAWPHLRILADFMEVSTSPMRWRKHFRPSPRNDARKQDPRQADREERWRRTNVARLDYLASGEVESTLFTNPESLEEALTLEKLAQSDTRPDLHLRLWVVEDLSRDVIELLGAAYDIEPAFFREHILDYAWHNVRDYWRDPPNLDVVARKQHWTQLRFVRGRYFRSVEAFRKGFEEAQHFNVLRRPDDDENNRTFWDRHDAKVGLMRSRASFWLRRANENGPSPAIGVLLLDPTMKTGCPLWRGYRNWEAAPGLYEPTGDDDAAPPPVLPTSPEQAERSFFDDFLYWAKKPDVFAALAPNPSATTVHVPVQALLHLICAEWLTISDYIKTRLTQIDWEIAYPETFLRHGTHAVKADTSLKKLHIWRRYVPIFREMISETLERVFQFPCTTATLLSPLPADGSGPGLTPLPSGIAPAAPPVISPVVRLAAAAAVTAAAVTATATDGNRESTDTETKTDIDKAPAHPRPLPGAIRAYERDYALALGYMEEYQQRIDRLTTVVTAVMGIADSRRALADNKNIGRLTWLATLFVPFSIVAATFSMQPDVTVISVVTVRWYFAVALPIAVLTLGLAIALSHEKVQKLLGFGNRWRDWADWLS